MSDGNYIRNINEEKALLWGYDEMKRYRRIFVPLIIFTLLFQYVLIFDFGTLKENEAYAEENLMLDKVAIAAGGIHSMTLKEDGAIWIWGDNFYGQLGIGESNYKKTPVKVESLTNVSAISAGFLHTLALKEDGTVWAWGQNCTKFPDEHGNIIELGAGRLGDGTKIDRMTPVQVSELDDAVDIDAGQFHSMALKSDGTVWTWGENYYGELGIGSRYGEELTPVQVINISDIIKITAGANHCLALSSNGGVYAWGLNNSNQLGVRTSDWCKARPVHVNGLSNAIAITAGSEHSMALKEDGTVWAWGYGYNGQTGNSSYTYNEVPTKITGLTNIIAIAAGDNHSMALRGDGTVWAWGYNLNGELGKGNINEKNPSPIQVAGLENVVAIAAGSNYSMALKEDGTLWAWGKNNVGQLGDNTTTRRLRPVQVFGFNVATPKLSINTPSINQVFKETDTSIQPEITVLNANNTTLTCKYYVDSEASPRDTKTITNTLPEKTVTFNALNMANLSEGTHTLRFEVNVGTVPVEKSVTFKVDKTAPTIGALSVTSTSTNISISGSATDSISGMHNTPYRFTIGNHSSNWTTDTEYTYNALPNTQYTVKFDARDSVNHIASKQQNIYTKAQIPSLAINDVSATSIELSSTDSNPATTKYQVKAGSQYVTSNGTLTSSPTWITLSGKKITINGLSPNQQYTISARAKNEEGLETLDNTKTCVTLANPPANIQAEETQTEIKLTWNAISGAKSYDVEIDGAVQNVGTSTNYTHTGLTPETQHRYRIRTRNTGGIGEWSSYIITETLPYPPETPQNILTNVEQTAITISWDTAFRATTYDIEIDDSIIEGITSTSYRHEGLDPKTEHKYRVRAVNKGGISAWSEQYIESTLPYPPITPTLKVSEMSKDKVNLSWNLVEDVENYHLKIDGLIMDMGMETTYIHEGLEPLSGHTYQIRAKNRGGNSAWSDPLDVTTYPEKPLTPTNIMATAEETNITVTWYEVAHTDEYDIEIDGNKIVKITDKMYVHTGLSPNEKHTYRVRAKNISGESEWSSPIIMTTLPKEEDVNISLSNVVAIVTNTSITISWDTVAYEAAYDLEIDGILYDNGENTIYHHTGLEANEFHTYKIRVRDDSGLNEWCAILSLSTLPNAPDAPTGIEALATENSIELRWEKVLNAESYDIEVDGEMVENETTNSYMHDSLESGTAHTYRVRAKNATGVTAWSTAIIKNTTNPIYRVSCTQGETFDFSLIANNVQDFTGLQFTITYNPDELELVDLYKMTPEQDTIDDGTIPETNISVKRTTGQIQLTLNSNIVPGTSWSGELAAIVFKSKINGESDIKFIVE